MEFDLSSEQVMLQDQPDRSQDKKIVADSFPSDNNNNREARRAPAAASERIIWTRRVRAT